MIFEELKYIYKGVTDYQKDKEFYLNMLKATLVWEFSRFGVRVAALKLGPSQHLTLIADHLKPDVQILIYRTENLAKSIKALNDRGLKFSGGTFQIPDGTCILFQDLSGSKYGIYQQDKPDSFLVEEYLRQQKEKT